MIRRIVTTAVLALTALAAASALAAQPFILLDAAETEALPRNFRSLDAARKTPEDRPLPGLAASGSAQFSEQGLDRMLGWMRGRVLIVDLRQESHGFANGAAISWYAENNWANQGLDPARVLADEAARLRAVQGRNISLRLDKGPDSRTLELAVARAETEADLCAARGLGYFRLAVPDHLRPQDPSVDRFLGLVDTLAPGDWLHFHCRAGKGRTTTFLLMYDILKNGREFGLEVLAARQRDAGGADLLDAEPEEGWRRQAYVERRWFLRRFQIFAAQRTKVEAWSIWAATNP
ncbi:MAG: phosphatase [Desulfovibrionaceae bacterium]|nr:phosphatase [Desulfovibrionaceae bacterium]